MEIKMKCEKKNMKNANRHWGKHEEASGKVQPDILDRDGPRMTQVDQTWFPVEHHQIPEQQPVLEPVWGSIHKPPEKMTWITK